MKNLTKERAHDLCVEMWNEVAENGFVEKSDSKLVQKYAPLYECFACEYYTKHFQSCEDCPFTKKIENIDNEENVACLLNSSPYTWFEDNPFNAKEHAIAIADLFIE